MALGYPTDKGTPIFDEKHYAPQAWEMVRSFRDPFVGGIEANPGYGLVVHPPLAKQLMGIGEFFFGYTPWGWRLTGAVLGIATVLLIMGIAYRIASTRVAFFAGLIATCDGVLLVASRTALLDIYQVFFIVLAAYLLLRDAEQMDTRYARVGAENRINDCIYGPRMGFRWWRFAAGLAIGGALSIKWSGLFYIAFFGLMSVMLDLARRWRYKVNKPVVGTLRWDTLPAMASLIVVPIATYVFSWRAWFADETSVYRHAATAGVLDGKGIPDFLPDSLRNWIYYHQSVLHFHSELTNSNGHHHPWESKPWEWIVSWRPMLYYDDTVDGIHHAVYLFGTPTIWWVCAPAMLWALWRLIRHQEGRWVFPVVGFAAGFLPWFLELDRQMYFFYATALVPFLALSLAMILGDVARWQPAKDPKTGRALAWGYMVAIIACFIFFMPLMYAMPLSEYWWDMHMWLPSWH